MNRIIFFSIVFFTSVTSLWAQNLTISWDENKSQDTTITVWKGERIGLKATVTVFDSLFTEKLVLKGRAKKGIQTEVGFLGPVITDDFKGCGNHPDSLETHFVWDLIDTDSAWTAQPDVKGQVWCGVDIPCNIKAGKNYVEFHLVGQETGRPYGYVGLYLNILDRSLPSPHDYVFHTDFWQQPYSVSRYYGLEEWSQDHIDMLKPYMLRLARGGQKVVSAILFYEPWGDQSFDKFSPMVQTTLKADSTWSYDYSIFDKWVKTMAECGIDQQIDCYSMVPWDMNFRYWDEAKGEYAFLKTKTTEAAYDSLWTNFLQSFATHLRDKGWFDKTCIAMDERGMDDMMRAYKIAQKAVPNMKMTLAGNYHKELVPLLQDYAVAFGQKFSPEELKARREKKQTSTVYTCCTEPFPNLFSNSDPLEGTYIPLYSLANDFDGYLHWSWMNWAEDPVYDSRYRLFSPGDTYCIYPDNHSSLRWEGFIAGVEMTEKARILRHEFENILNTEDSLLKEGEKEAATIALDTLNASLLQFQDGDASNPRVIKEKIESLNTVLNGDIMNAVLKKKENARKPSDTME